MIKKLLTPSNEFPKFLLPETIESFVRLPGTPPLPGITLGRPLTGSNVQLTSVSYLAQPVTRHIGLP